MERKRSLWILLGILVVVAGAYSIYSLQGSPGEYDGFAICLTEAGAVKYGTDWCGYCKQQKDLFGNSFDYVNYVNCDYNGDECVVAGVGGYPTWKINGELYPGVQSLERLSQLTGCKLNV